MVAQGLGGWVWSAPSVRVLPQRGAQRGAEAVRDDLGLVLGLPCWGAGEAQPEIRVGFFSPVLLAFWLQSR